MVSSFAIAAAEGFQPEDRPRVVDKIVADLQFVASEPENPSRQRFGGGRPFRAATAPQSPRGPPIDDDLEERLEDKLHFSINGTGEAGQQIAGDDLSLPAAWSAVLHSRRRSSPIHTGCRSRFLEEWNARGRLTKRPSDKACPTASWSQFPRIA